jgi:hypothetical protein
MGDAADRTTRDHFGCSPADRLFMRLGGLVRSVGCDGSAKADGRRPKRLGPTFNGMNKTTRPKHIRHFNHPAAEVIWSAVMTLDEPAKHEVYEHLADHLVVERGRHRRHHERREASVAALREAAELLGHSPSVREFRELVHDHPEYGWPNDSAIRRWFGNSSWNEALHEAGLAHVADGDFVGASAGYQFELSDIVRAARLCAEETGFAVPPQSVYLGWAARSETQRRYERIPRTMQPFARYGGYHEVLVQAGLRAPDGAVSYPDGTIRPAKFRYDDEDMFAALREVAARLGHSPLTREYRRERDKIREESARAGALRTLPAWGVIRTRFGTWDEALTGAGLEPTNGRVTGARNRRQDYVRKGGVRFTDEQLFASMQAAFADLGINNMTAGKYKRWRLESLAEAEGRGEYRKIPGYMAFQGRFGTWDAAKRAAVEDALAREGREEAA